MISERLCALESTVHDGKCCGPRRFAPSVDCFRHFLKQILWTRLKSLIICKPPCQRPYHAERTGSRPITEVKQRRASSVLGWVTAWEHGVLLALTFLSFLFVSIFYTMYKDWNSISCFLLHPCKENCILH